MDRLSQMEVTQATEISQLREHIFKLEDKLNYKPAATTITAASRPKWQSLLPDQNANNWEQLL